MSADSPRHTRTGAPLTVPSQPPSDRSLIDAVSVFINDVALSSSSSVDPRDIIQWARFETADINEPMPDGDNDSEISPLLLILGYGSGVQVWLVSPSGEAQEVLSWKQGNVKILRILPSPQHDDRFSTKRPLIALCDASGPGPMFCSLSYISLRGGDQVKSLNFKNPILDVQANKRSIVVTFSEKFAVFDASTLENRLAVTTCYPCPCPLGGSAPLNPISLGDRWLAYADKKLQPSKRSSGGCEGESKQSYTATVLCAAKSLGKGLRGIGESVAQSLAGGRASSQSPSPPNTEQQQPGIVTILDIESTDDDFCKEDQEPRDPIVVHFPAHSDAIIALKFDPSGMLLVTADRRGRDFRVFRINPHTHKPNLASVHHLYILHRGDTTAKVQDIAISLDSRWVAISTLRGTTHVFPMTAYGGNCGVRTHTQPRVVNKLSRFQRSAGLPLQSSALQSEASSPSMYNPRVPPYPQPVTLSPLVQLRPSAVPHTITRTSSGRQRLSSQSEEGATGVPLLVRASFGPPAPAPAHAPVAAHYALYLVSASGLLVHHLLRPRPASGVPKEKVCDESPIELDEEAVEQWPLQRPPNAADLLAPLPISNPLLQRPVSRGFVDTTGFSEEERWLSQVEMVTHAGPHRRLWMGPQFVFKTFTSTSNTSLSEAETVEVDTHGANTPRSNPVNMPGGRALVPVYIDSGSTSSLEHSPSGSLRRKSAATERAAVCDVQLKEDLAEAMKEDSGAEERRGQRPRPAPGARSPVVRAVEASGVVTAAAERAPPEPPPPPPLPLPRGTRLPVQSVRAARSPPAAGPPAPLPDDVVIPAELTRVASAADFFHDSAPQLPSSEELSNSRALDVEDEAGQKLHEDKNPNEKEEAPKEVHDIKSRDPQELKFKEQQQFEWKEPQDLELQEPQFIKSKQAQELKLKEPQEIKLKELQDLKIQEPQLIKSKEAQELKSKLRQESKLKETQELILKEPQEIKLKEPKGLKLQETQELKLKLRQELKLKELQEIKLKQPQELKLKEPQELKLKEPEESKLKETQVFKLKLPQELKLKEPQELKLNEPQELKLNQPQQIKSKEPQESKLKEPKLKEFFKWKEPQELKMKEPQLFKWKEREECKLKEPQKLKQPLEYKSSHSDDVTIKGIETFKQSPHSTKIVKKDLIETFKTENKNSEISGKSKIKKICEENVETTEVVKKPVSDAASVKTDIHKDRKKKKESSVERKSEVEPTKDIETTKRKSEKYEPTTETDLVLGHVTEITAKVKSVNVDSDVDKDKGDDESKGAIPKRGGFYRQENNEKMEVPKECPNDETIPESVERHKSEQIKTEDQAWDMLLNEYTKPDDQISFSETGETAAEDKSKSKRSKRKVKLSQGFVEIHSIVDVPSRSVSELVSISPRFEDTERFNSYALKTKQTRQQKSPVPEQHSELINIDHKIKKSDVYDQTLIKSCLDTRSENISENIKIKSKMDNISNTLDISAVIQVDGREDNNKSRKTKSLSPFLEKESKRPAERYSLESIDKKSVIVINSTKDDFPDIQITTGKTCKISPIELITDDLVPEKPIKSWSSIAATNSGKITQQINKEAAKKKKIISDTASKEKEISDTASKEKEISETTSDFDKVSNNNPNPVSSEEASLQAKLDELYKKEIISKIVECDAPTELNFVDEHHSEAKDLPPLESLDFGLGDMNLEELGDSFLEGNNDKTSSPICKINIDDILSSIKETTNKAIQSSSLNYLVPESVTKVDNTSTMESEKVTSSDKSKSKIRDEHYKRRNKSNLETFDKSSDEEYNSPLACQSDGNKDDKKNLNATPMQAALKQNKKKSKKKK